MNFTHYDLGNLEKDRIVEITLQGSAANVQLLDSTNFSSYKNGKNYRYIGGLAKRSPVRLQTTHSGRHGRKFCVSVFRQTQEYRICNVHDRGLFPFLTGFPGG